MKWFLLEHIKTLSEKYDVTVMANTQDFSFIHPLNIQVNTISNHIERKISLTKDVRALFHLAKILSQQKFDAIHSVTPKAGLLSMLAGFLTGIPIRIHTFTGQIWVTRSGVSRYIFKNLDRVIAFLATGILVDSFSQKNFLIENKIISPSKSLVLGQGSIAGVDTSRFSPSLNKRLNIREKLNIHISAIVFLFVGRLTCDKGILDLVGAFIRLRQARSNVHLLIVGPDEDDIIVEIRKRCQADSSSITFVNQTDVPEDYMAASDILCLPSYREGFGNVILEGAASGIPAIGSRIYGITDAIEENVTGLLHKPADENSILEKMLVLIDDVSTREEMGRKARQRAIMHFSKEQVTAALVDYYGTVMNN